MSESNVAAAERFFHFTRRSLGVMLLLILVLGIGGLAVTIAPDGAVARGISRVPWLLPLAIVMAVVVLQTDRRRQRFDANSAAMSAVMNDELRQANLARSRTVAFVTVIVAQMPIALIIGQTPLGLGLGLGAGISLLRGLMAMAIATITLGLSVFIASFLAFDRE
jgi:hypothetical protein